MSPNKHISNGEFFRYTRFTEKFQRVAGIAIVGTAEFFAIRDEQILVGAAGIIALAANEFFIHELKQTQDRILRDEFPQEDN
jgi:hypothetical protein